MLLNYRQYSDRGRPLLILHGLFGNLGNWGWHSKQLAAHFAVYGVDLRNHGDSPHADALNYQVMAADVKELLQHLGLSSCYLIGHSMGGKVAMQLALGEPNLVDRLLVVDIAPVHYLGRADDHHTVIDAMNSLDPARLGSRAEAQTSLAQYVKDEDTLKFLLTNLVRNPEGGYRWRLNIAAITKHYDRLREKPEGTNPFEKPVLFVKGALSNYIQDKHEQEIRAMFPNSAVKVIDDAGHWLHADKPQALLQLALDFFQQDQA